MTVSTYLNEMHIDRLHEDSSYAMAPNLLILLAYLCKEAHIAVDVGYVNLTEVDIEFSDIYTQLQEPPCLAQ